MPSRSWLAAAAFLLSFSVTPIADRIPASANPGIPLFFAENFENVVPPALPPGWTATLAQGEVGDQLWMSTTSHPYRGTKDVLALAPGHVTDNRLETAPISIGGGSLRPALVFWHMFGFENGFDGGVVEIKIGGGAFIDIISAGGTFLNNGYTGTISMNFQNPLAGRDAFTGSSGDTYVRTVIKLPPAALGQTVRFRFRLGTDVSFGGTAWFLDDVFVNAWATGEQDFNGDLLADRTIYRPSNNVWYSRLTGGGTTATGWGISGDVDVSADYDGDGKHDIAVWRPSSGTWFIVQSSNGAVQTFQWGQSGDIPMAGPTECCGTIDANADATIWRPSTGTWFIRSSSGNPPTVFQWGTNGDQPLIGDYVGLDWIQDLMIFRPGTGIWYVAADGGQNGTGSAAWGAAGDVPVAGDWDGDARNDVAIFRPTTGQWWIRNSLTLTTTVMTWGVNGDMPIGGEYNGDGLADFVVWRPSNGVWYTRTSSGIVSALGWGVPGDLPVGRRPGS